MTTSKIIENTGVPELEKAEHRGKDILKKDEVQSSHHFDETWVPGQGWVRMRDGSSESKSVKPARAKDIEHRLHDRLNLYRWSPERMQDLSRRVSLYREAKHQQRHSCAKSAALPLGILARADIVICGAGDTDQPGASE
mmetsp:Transcript_21582/g.45376  ORF Transcript_21582/g.45376 Transcript_21582/m.45376 type:complete len:139 (+) Transcript_21582:777-1193(+)|eukprot:CAMPEP_0172158460 /NCGR_PEP_ID=MMETSP1050-20130122/4385_1 /TAXON_ID=233186 /ORGANISM="Cryptomonas curvata, Strain CCAP979/52" /LENGTH=138 /DNA_ID=CAMNT_0012827855 /DNA_START=703 /DNA_END=1119 /DNA_ORIENTATION=+